MEYDDQIAGLEARIAELAVLRKAQEDDTTRAERLQMQINETTDELLAVQDRKARYEQMRPQLDEAKAAAEQATKTHRRALRDCEQQAGQWLNVAKLGGVVGLVAMLASMVPVTPSWLGWVAGVAFVGAVGSVLMWVKTRRDWDGRIQEADEASRVTREYREALLEQLDAPVPAQREGMPEQWPNSTAAAELASEPFGAYPR